MANCFLLDRSCKLHMNVCLESLSLPENLTGDNKVHTFSFQCLLRYSGNGRSSLTVEVTVNEDEQFLEFFNKI